MQDPSSENEEAIGAVLFLDSHSEVFLYFAVQPVANLPAGYILSFLAVKGGSINRKEHVNCWLIDMNRLKAFRVFKVSDRIANFKILNTENSAKVSGFYFFHPAFAES